MLLKTGLWWGLALGVLTALATQMLTWAGLGLTNWFAFVSIFLTILVIVRVSNKLQNGHNGKLSFTNALAVVVLVVLVARFVFQIYMFVYTRYIDPSWVDTVAQRWTETMQASGISTDKISVQIQSFRNSYETVPMFTTALILYGIPQLFFGFLTSLIFVFDVKNKLKNKKS